MTPDCDDRHGSSGEPAGAELVERVMSRQAELGRREVPGESPLRNVVPQVCPFMGLASYGVGDAEYFFGRASQVAEVASRLDSGSFLAIVGDSGSGKSPVLQAGLLPALAGGLLPGSARWRQVLLCPGNRPTAMLRGALGMAPEDRLEDVVDSLADGERLLALVQRGFAVEIWDVKQREVVADHSLSNVLTALSPDGRLFAGRAMLDFSPDGRRLLATTDQGTASVADLDPQSWADRACAVANRTLTESEWAEYLPGRPYQPACAQ